MMTIKILIIIEKKISNKNRSTIIIYFLNNNNKVSLLIFKSIIYVDNIIFLNFNKIIILKLASFYKIDHELNLINISN
jgi:hypothetical protein